MRPKILALTLVSPDLPEIILMRFKKAKEALEEFSRPYFDIDWILDDRKEPELPNDIGAISKVARIRNHVIDEFLTKNHEWVFWIDADIVEFQESLLLQLYESQIPPNIRIVAPKNFIELTDKWYDWGAFIQAGTSHILPDQIAQVWGRNLSSDPPYWHPAYLRSNRNLVEMDCVAQCLLVPAEVYRSGARHTYSAFYEFFSVCEAARNLGVKTYVDRMLVAFHADRSLYGRNWS